MNIFRESNGVFSWRKAGTALIFILFAYCVSGYCITHNWDEIPGTYQGIIAMVFFFYFAKEGIRNATIKKSVQPDPNDPNPR